MDDLGKALSIVAAGTSGVLALVLMLGPGDGDWLNVDGNIVGSGAGDQAECELRLMEQSGSQWFGEEPVAVEEGRVVKVGERFEETFTLEGPTTRDHWIEIDCPGYRRFTSPTFPAPGGCRRADRSSPASGGA